MKLKSEKANLIFRLTCFLLVVTSFTCISLAKYISSRQNPANAEIGAFRCSVNLQLKSDHTYTFFNAQYIVNNVVMNHPQIIPFVVNNCDLNADGTYSEPSGVDLKYDLIFYIPREFAAISALQVSKIDETTKEEVAATPLYLLNDFLGTSTEVTVLGEYWGKQEGVEGVDINYESLKYTYENSTDNKETFKRSSGETLWEGDKNTILIIEKVPKNANIKYVFQTFNHKPGTGDTATSHAALNVVKNVKDIEFYKIRISRPEFVLKGGSRQDINYNLRLTTTGGMDKTSDYQDVPFGTSFNDFVAMLPTNETEKSYTMQWENKSCTITQDETDKEMWTIDNSEKSEKLYIDTFIQKNFPVRVNAVFTQTKIV